MKKSDKMIKAISKYKYPILALLIGIVIMSLPLGDIDFQTKTKGTQDEERLADILSMCKGVGKAEALLSDKGAVIVCDGADDAEVRLKVMNAVSAYTGLGFDKIEVLKTRQDQEGQNE